MKIIKPGAPHNWWVGIKWTCSSCLAQLQPEEGDEAAKLIRKESVSPDIWITCPHCGTATKVYFSHLFHQT